jgi:hypothetical protein
MYIPIIGVRKRLAFMTPGPCELARLVVVSSLSSTVVTRCFAVVVVAAYSLRLTILRAAKNVDRKPARSARELSLQRLLSAKDLAVKENQVQEHC